MWANDVTFSYLAQGLMIEGIDLGFATDLPFDSNRTVIPQQPRYQTKRERIFYTNTLIHDTCTLCFSFSSTRLYTLTRHVRQDSGTCIWAYSRVVALFRFSQPYSFFLNAVRMLWWRTGHR